MNELSRLVIIGLLILSALVVMGNWAAALISFRRWKRGVSGHVSTVPLLAQLLAAIAAVVSLVNQATYPPTWVYWAVPLADVSLYSLAYVPIFQYLRRRKTS